MLTDPSAIIIVCLTLLAAGTVKGVIGLGLPTVSLGVLTAVFDLTTAMVLMAAPSFVTNVWQGAVGGNGAYLLKRLWPFLLLATVTIWLGAEALGRLALDYLSGLLGLLLIAYAAISLAGFRISVPAAHQRWAGPAFGTINGVLTGMTGSFVVPGVLYLQAIGLTRDQLVQAMGMLFTVSTVALAIALQRHGIITADLGLTSAISIVPAIIGMVMGQKIRRRLSEAKFRKVFFGAIALLGLYICANAALGG